MTFQELLEEFGIPYARQGEHHHARKGWVQFDCPFCSPGSGKYRMGYNAFGRYCNCWTCGGHFLSETVVQLTGESAEKVARLLVELELPAGADHSLPRRRGRFVTPDGLTDLLPLHKSYLRKRLLDPVRVQNLWALKGIGPLGGYLSWRIWIPIIYQGLAVSWTTRLVVDMPNRPKYLTADPDHESMNHRDLLFGEDYVRHAVIIHEGPFDVLRTGPGSVCTFGLNWSPVQLAKLSRFPVRVVCFDNEPEARRRAKRLMDELTPFQGETHMVTLDAKDAGEATEKEIRKLRMTFLGESVSEVASGRGQAKTEVERTNRWRHTPKQ